MKYSKGKHSRRQTIRGLVFAFVLTVTPFLQAPFANAGTITNRKITLSTSVGDASGVTYTLTSDALPTTGTAIKSVGVQFCTSLEGACSTPAGFSASASTLAVQPSGVGAGSGWTVNTASAGSLRIVNAANATNPSGSVSIQWGGVHNPTATNTTFYAKITTYSDAAWTTAVDSSDTALSTSAQIQVVLDVNEALTFCTGTSITGQNCATVAGSTVDLGTASTTATATGTSVFAASTNGEHGYTVTVTGPTLTSGSNTITAMAANAASSVGTSQFGINLVSNATPSVGSNVSGTGTAAATANYNTANSFRFASGDAVASVSVPTNANAFTVSYIANIAGVTPPGIYTTNLHYDATANY
ncbi:MAG: hypothetical protein H6797_00895 [Candidatus Nomurabacteria bacterium]|nr:MAG: hypothetical protein H6797_00895 [Candidatus Nomurabacteria bacterium]